MGAVSHKVRELTWFPTTVVVVLELLVRMNVIGGFIAILRCAVLGFFDLDELHRVQQTNMI